MITATAAALALAAALQGTAPQAPPAPSAPPDPWKPVRFLVGTWEGTSEGESGTGGVRRTYAFVLEGRYLHETNVTTYPPQEKNPKGERHEHWSFLSHDRARKTLVLRQFHQEGFVNTYVLDAAGSGATRLVFESVGFENLDSSWRARETYEIVSPDEFVETFELAPPGKPFQVYSRTRLRRAG